MVSGKLCSGAHARHHAGVGYGVADSCGTGFQNMGRPIKYSSVDTNLINRATHVGVSVVRSIIKHRARGTDMICTFFLDLTEVASDRLFCLVAETQWFEVLGRYLRMLDPGAFACISPSFVRRGYQIADMPVHAESGNL